MIDKHPMRGPASMALVLGVMMLAPFPADALVRLPDDEAQRNELVARLGRLCRDYTFSSQRVEGIWLLEKGARISLPTYELVYDEATNTFERVEAGQQPSNLTPKGCQLICKIKEHRKYLIFVTNPNLKKPFTNSTNPPDAYNGTGTHVGVHYNPGDDDNTFYVHDRQGNEEKQPVDIAIGHELIHALHGMDGTGKADATDPTMMDEGQTIDGSSPGGAGGHGITENDLRDEQNRLEAYRPPLRWRKGHRGCRRR